MLHCRLSLRAEERLSLQLSELLRIHDQGVAQFVVDVVQSAASEIVLKANDFIGAGTFVPLVSNLLMPSQCVIRSWRPDPIAFLLEMVVLLINVDNLFWLIRLLGLLGQMRWWAIRVIILL